MPLPLIILGLLVFLPLAELYVLIKVGAALGALVTVVLVVFTAVFGVLLVRYQGWATFQRIRASLARGEMPALAMLETGALWLGGLLLLLPGFITDALGLLMLIGPVRRAILMSFFTPLGGSLRRTEGRSPPRRPPPHRPSQGDDSSPEGPRTIEGEYRRDD